MNAPPIQQKIEIEDVQEGVILLKDGSLRAILMASSVNFSLKSTEEQDALIYKYQGFLNSLDFPLQILTVSRILDISDYLGIMEQKRKEQANELLRIQIAEYKDFIKNLVQVGNIINQSFYVVITLLKAENKQSGFLEKLGLGEAKNNRQETQSLDELKAQLWQRVEYVSSGLTGVGVKSTPLNTEEVTQLFYHLYNMGTKDNPSLKKEEEAK
jgi:type IV secretory pathway VirB4 component